MNINSNRKIIEEKEQIEANASIGTIITRQDYINIEEVENNGI